MGVLFSKMDKKEEEINNDIIELNNITNNELFYKKTNYKITFSKLKSFFTNITGKNIKCQIVINKIK